MTTIHTSAPAKDSAVHLKAGPSTNDDLLKQQDPGQLMVNVLAETNNDLIQLQSSTATTEQFWAVGASNAVLKGNEALKTAALAVQQAKDQGAQTSASSALQVLQTQVSNTDQEYNNVVTGGATVMNALTQAESQGLQLGSVAISQKADVNNLLAGWAN